MTQRRARAIAAVSALLAVVMAFIPGSVVHWLLTALFAWLAFTHYLMSRRGRRP